MPNIIKLLSTVVWRHWTTDEISVCISTSRVPVRVVVSHALNLKQTEKDLLWHWNLVGYLNT